MQIGKKYIYLYKKDKFWKIITDKNTEKLRLENWLGKSNWKLNLREQKLKITNVGLKLML